MGRGHQSKMMRKVNRGTDKPMNGVKGNHKDKRGSTQSILKNMEGVKIHILSHEGEIFWVGYWFVDINGMVGTEGNPVIISNVTDRSPHHNWVKEPDPLFSVIRKKFQIQWKLGMVSHLESRKLGQKLKMLGLK
jgi:hypothetical protein